VKGLNLHKLMFFLLLKEELRLRKLSLNLKYLLSVEHFAPAPVKCSERTRDSLISPLYVTQHLSCGISVRIIRTKHICGLSRICKDDVNRM